MLLWIWSANCLLWVSQHCMSGGSHIIKGLSAVPGAAHALRKGASGVVWVRVCPLCLLVSLSLFLLLSLFTELPLSV